MKLSAETDEQHTFNTTHILGDTNHKTMSNGKNRHLPQIPPSTLLYRTYIFLLLHAFEVCLFALS